MERKIEKGCLEKESERERFGAMCKWELERD